MRLLVTRPEEDAVAFKAHLVALGHQVTIEPLLTISTADADPIELEGAPAIIATSRNGLRALAGSEQLDAAKLLPLFAVGPGTAAVARSLGFTAIVEGPSRSYDVPHFVGSGARAREQLGWVPNTTLTDGLQMLISQQELRLQMGEAGRQRVQHGFAWADKLQLVRDTIAASFPG